MSEQVVPDPERGRARIPIRCLVNGQETAIQIEPAETLAEVLRERLHLTGAKISCDLQVCGACTVLVDGAPVSACTYLAYEARGRRVETIEGLAEPGGPLHPLQQAFIDEYAFQCGFCTPGMILAAKSLLDLQPDASEAEIVAYMEGNLCRCTGYRSIVRAVQRAQRVLTSRGVEESSESRERPEGTRKNDESSARLRSTDRHGSGQRR